MSPGAVPVSLGGPNNLILMDQHDLVTIFEGRMTLKDAPTAKVDAVHCIGLCRRFATAEIERAGDTNTRSCAGFARRLTVDPVRPMVEVGR
jgi:hypothetical protein